jgi:hypothetical protein
MTVSQWALPIAGAILCLPAPSWAQPDNSAWHADPIPALRMQPMNFENGDVKLAGTLYMPDRGDRVPAVIVLWGAQAPTRKFAMYQQLATGLPAIGVAILVFDRVAATGTRRFKIWRATASRRCVHSSTIRTSIPNA